MTRDSIDRALADLPGWAYDGTSLVKLFEFRDFPEAVAFVGRLVPGAEAFDHHPDLAISYRRVTVSWTTHSDGGVTEKDVRAARMTDASARP
jgi:4a-hydroxytetrahydrobiopterin dehydratase